MLECPYCKNIKSSVKSLRAHSAVCARNPNRKIPWNAGLSKETDIRVAESAKSATGKTRPDISGSNHPYYGKQWGSTITGHSDSTKLRLSSIASSRGLGGYVRGSGRGKKGWYKGFFCDSSWELAFVIYCLDHNMQIQRNTERREYEWEGKIRNYIPDFIVDGKLVEIKGYKTAQWLEKLAANQDITVLYEQELKPYLRYVIETYGKDYVSLYE